MEFKNKRYKFGCPKHIDTILKSGDWIWLVTKGMTLDFLKREEDQGLCPEHIKRSGRKGGTKEGERLR